MNSFLGYEVEDGEILGAPCGCYACDHERQPGHRYCDVPSPELLEAEGEGIVYRNLDNSTWRWYVNEKGQRMR